MKFSTIATTLAFLATSTVAAPTARQFEAQITFHGATSQDTFTQSVPTDGTEFYIFPLMPESFDFSSITSISSEGGATCTFTGIDGSETTVVGAQTVDVGPPQQQLSGSCLAL